MPPLSSPTQPHPLGLEAKAMLEGPITRVQFEKACAEICPSCAAGVPARKRTDTNEWVHDATRVLGPGARSISHSLCLAHYFRQENEARVSG